VSDASAQVVADLIAAWPEERPLAVVWEGGARGRSIVAEPSAVFCAWADGSDPLASLDAELRRTEGGSGGWVACFSYDLGRVIEPAVQRPPLSRPHAREDRRWPLIEMQRVERGAVVDGSGRIEPMGRWKATSPRPPEDPGTFTTGTSRDGMSRGEYEAAVSRVVEYIRAGDVFQANIAHRISVDFRGSARAAFVALARRAAPWHGAYMEGSGRAVLSVSPELFLEVDTTARRVVSRPMKGTRSAASDPGELERSAKDRAELNMIIDLMRNDLGRVARLGSVRVVEERRIERHGGDHGVLQATGTVEAALRDGVGWAEILRATFPPGSVTGAPKIRAMQIIDELEPARRGPYCGAVGFIADRGTSRLAVAIRTALITGETSSPGVFSRGVLDYSVGAGIVAESEPGAEWEETITKASVLGALGIHD
jgi:anthranilate/para-aminobenzoate synthase component I